MFDTSAASAILREYYGDKGVPNSAYKNRPATGTLKKKKISGKYIDWPVQYGFAANRSHTGTVALTAPNAPPFQEFNVPTIADYDKISVEKKALVEAKDEGAFLDILTNAVESVTNNLGNRIEFGLFMHRGASIGVVSSVSGTSLVLTQASDINRFEKGMELRSSEANGLSGSLQAGSATVTAVDRDTYTLTTDVDWTTQIATLDAGDFLFADGDFGIGRAGLPDWCPDDTSGLGTAFYGATRSYDATRLAGHRQSGDGLSVQQAVRKLCAKAGNQGQTMDTALISINQMDNLVTDLDNKVTYIKEGSSPDAEIGYDAVTIIGGASKIKFLATHGCPDDHIYVFNKDTVEIVHSQSSPVEIEDWDGDILAREATGFSFDVRGQSFLNFRVINPAQIGVVHSLAA